MSLVEYLPQEICAPYQDYLDSFLLLSFTGHPRVQGEPICLGHSFQSGVRPVQRADSANHEGLAPLLWADGDPVGDGTAEDLRHSIVVFSRVEIQPRALRVLFQQTPALQAATCARADQLNQLLQLVLVRCRDALKAGRTIVATHVDAVQEQDMEVNIQVQCTTKTLNQRHRSSRAVIEF